MEADGELAISQAAVVRRHLDDCAQCRKRQAEILEMLTAVSDQHSEQEMPPIDGARAMLVSKMRPARGQQYLALAALAAALLLLAWHWAPERVNNSLPRTALTPGATQAAWACAAETERPPIANAVAMEVFRKYGIHDPRPRAYEVDYLIPPDLGGSEDPRNLWPQPYNAGTWNARVKDALEDRLRTMVCSGSIDLAIAQQEIASDWIKAYQKHFRTRSPLPDHVAFVKDQPWE
jgi:hypothetical protein